MSDEIKSMAMISLDDGAVMPGMSFYLDAVKKDACDAIGYAIKNGDCIFLAVPAAVENGRPRSFHEIGVIAKINQLVRLQNKSMRVRLETMRRARLISYERDRYYMCSVREVSDTNDLTEDETKAMIGLLRDRLHEAFARNMVKNKIFYQEIRMFNDVGKLVDSMADYLNISDEKRQELLGEPDVRKRAVRLVQIVDEELQISVIRSQIMEEVGRVNAENQRKYVLREELSVIKKELGEDGTDSNADEFEERLKRSGCSKEVCDRIEKEIRYYRSIPQNSSESSVSANYIDTMLDYPWNEATKDNDDIGTAIDILNRDHYGLEEVKERIIDYLAVHMLSGKGNLPIICLVGPPGTGKTSIARSIARATSRRYVRMSLGGVRDETEIRGHRKTYVGAMPGRIVQSMIKVGVNNPLMLLDEIDKVSSDYKGDVSSALLEVLDSEQNSEFADRYMGVPIDLSKVLFIATANDMSGIPGPLLDRMEIINISGYTENEKYHIARLYLVDKVRERNGLTKSRLKIDAGAIREIIRYYTREAGVRELERSIDKVCRKACRMILTDDSQVVKVTKKNVEEFLGARRYKDEQGNLKNKVGAVRGLAWTAVGGVTLEIEANVFPGNGSLQLTGKMGDVMKESAQAGMSYIRALDESKQLGEDYFTKHDFHIHIPEGAVPKDGPSAGITMATALYSAIFGIPVSGSFAMTGEITLRGEILPIGGLKEKLLAAKMVGVKKILIPAGNESDYLKLDDEIKSGIEVCMADSMKQVLKAVLVSR